MDKKELQFWCDGPNWVNRIGRIQPWERKFVSKIWGFEEWLANSELYCLKKLFFKQGKRCSWHYHHKKIETFTLLSGEIYIEYSIEDCISPDRTEVRNANHYKIDSSTEIAGWTTLLPGDVFHVPPLLRHRMAGTVDSFIFEVSTFHDDEDVVRLLPGGDCA